MLRRSSSYISQRIHDRLLSIESYSADSKLSFRSWMVIVVEALLGFCWVVIHERRMTSEDLMRRKQTFGQEKIDMFWFRGMSAFGCAFAMYLADTYLSAYGIALINVMIYFFATSALLMEEIIKYNDYDLYATTFSSIAVSTFVPLYSTSFARALFGLQNIGNRNRWSVVKFVFLCIWVQYKGGSLINAIINSFHLQRHTRVCISFVASCVATILYCFVLPPTNYKYYGSRYGNQVIGCVYMALKLRWLTYNTMKQINWLDMAEIKYSKDVIDSTRTLLNLYLMVLPASGFLLYTSSGGSFDEAVWERLKPEGLFEHTGLILGIQIVVLASMIIIQFVILPMLYFIGISKIFFRRFIIGCVAALFSFAFSAFTLNSVQLETPISSSAKIKIYNFATVPVKLSSRNSEFNDFRTFLDITEFFTLVLGTEEDKMALIMVTFEGLDINYTMYISAEPNRMVAYFVVDPPNIIRLLDPLPVVEGPPGTTMKFVPILYLVNLNTKNVGLILEKKDYTIVFHVVLRPGKMFVRSVPPGEYTLSSIDVNYKPVHLKILYGATYGVYYYSNQFKLELMVDKLVPENTKSSYYAFVTCFSYATALTLAYVTLGSWLFLKAPQRLEALSVGYLVFIEYMMCWVIWAGYKFWHPHVTFIVFAVYSIALISSLVFCSVMMIRFDDI